MNRILIKNALLINERKRLVADVLIEGERIKEIRVQNKRKVKERLSFFTSVIDASGLLLLPGAIDDQVHFREPGLTHKGDIHSESRAAVAGGITSFMDMPNTIPQTGSVKTLNEKFELASKQSFANYSFFIGATNDNVDELKKGDAGRAAAIKVFMGASTGNMLVDDKRTLERIFSETKQIIAVHCECEKTIAANKARYMKKFGEDLNINFHPKIRDAQACFNSSSYAVELAKKYNSRLHVFHLSTERELSLFDAKPLNEKRITAEVCVHHLWFSDEDYSEKGNRIKWNPAIKTRTDRNALRQALIDGKIDIVATDHAPHTWEEKQGSCFQAASGGPMVQHALTAMLELCKQRTFTEELVIEKMAHAPAILFGIKERGFIREGYYADMVLVNPNSPWTVSKDNLLYKCGWSPMEGVRFSHKVEKTFVNGRLVYDNGRFDEEYRAKELEIFTTGTSTNIT